MTGGCSLSRDISNYFRLVRNDMTGTRFLSYYPNLGWWFLFSSRGSRFATPLSKGALNQGGALSLPVAFRQSQMYVKRLHRT